MSRQLCGMPTCGSPAEYYINCLGTLCFYCNACRLSFPSWTWHVFIPLPIHNADEFPTPTQGIAEDEWPDLVGDS